MTNKSEFTTDEWTLLRQAPPLAGLRVAVADHGGAYREVASIAEAYGDAHESWWAPPAADRHVELTEQILAEGPAFDRARFGSDPGHLRAPDIVAAALGALREAVSLLERKASAEELDHYAHFVLAMAHRVAQSHREGAFLGLGGQPVSDKEQAALDEIAQVLPTRQPG
jgi:hypothetical protein